MLDLVTKEESKFKVIGETTEFKLFVQRRRLVWESTRKMFVLSFTVLLQKLWKVIIRKQEEQAEMGMLQYAYYITPSKISGDIDCLLNVIALRFLNVFENFPHEVYFIKTKNKHSFPMFRERCQY